MADRPDQPARVKKHANRYAGARALVVLGGSSGAGGISQMSLDLYEVIDEIADELAERGVYLPDAYKRRDPDEPGRALKERDEDRLFRLTMRRFRTQKRKIVASLKLILPPVKAITTPGPGDWMKSIPDDVFIDPETERLLLKLLVAMVLRGVEVFKQQTNLQVDWTLVNTSVVKWAREYLSEFLRGLDDTTRKALREALEAFASQPGFTIADVAKVLPFDEARALRIARTEITRIYAEAAQEAGRALKEQYPGVRVEKRWFTNNDSLVCPICSPLNGKIVEVDDGFGVEPGEVGLLHPPAHPGCRCWISTRTRI